MAWFKRKEKGIQTATENKKDVPKGYDSKWEHKNSDTA